MFPYRIYVDGDKTFNNYFLFSYYLSSYISDSAVLYSAKPSNIHHMTEVFASGHNLFHLSCDMDKVLQHTDKNILFKKIAQETNFALIFRDPNKADEYHDLLYAFTLQNKEFRIIDVFPEDIIVPTKTKSNESVVFSEIYKEYLEQLKGMDHLSCYKFLAIMLANPYLLDLVLQNKDKIYITSNPIEQQIVDNLNWILTYHTTTLHDILKSLKGEVEEIKPEYKETEKYDWSETGENIPVYTGTGLLLANGYHSVVYDGKESYIEIEYNRLVRSHIHQSLYSIMYEENTEDDTDRINYHTSDTEAYPIFYQSVMFTGSPFRAKYWYINSKYVTVKK